MSYPRSFVVTPGDLRRLTMRVSRIEGMLCGSLAAGAKVGDVLANGRVLVGWRVVRVRGTRREYSKGPGPCGTTLVAAEAHLFTSRAEAASDRKSWRVWDSTSLPRIVRVTRRVRKGAADGGAGKRGG